MCLVLKPPNPDRSHPRPSLEHPDPADGDGHPRLGKGRRRQVLPGGQQSFFPAGGLLHHAHHGLPLGREARDDALGGFGGGGILDDPVVFQGAVFDRQFDWVSGGDVCR